jgi:drug/metabolite transporter (DMT)-like permease
LQILPALALTLNAFVFGVSWWPFQALQAHGLHPLWATAFIFVFSLVCILLVRRGGWRAFLEQPLLWLLLLSSGLTNVGFNWAVTIGDVVRVVLLFYLMPAWVVLLAWPLLGEKPSTGSLLRLALALAGVAIVLKTPGSDWPWPQGLADWLALMGGFSFAVTNILLRKLAQTPESSRMLAMFGGGALLALGTACWGMQTGLVNAPPALAASWLGIAVAVSLAFLAGNLALQYGAARLSASATSLIMLTEVLFASVSSAWLGAADLGPRVVAGGALILLASLLSIVDFKKSPS